MEENNALKANEKRILRDEKGLFLEGNPPGPGRPKGKTIKERVREWLEEHPDDMQSFVEHFVKSNRDLAWQMLEGRPSQQLQGDPDNPLVQIVFDKAFEKDVTS